MKIVATIVHVQGSYGFMMESAEPARDELVWGKQRGRHLVLKEDADAAVAAALASRHQPAAPVEAQAENDTSPAPSEASKLLTDEQIAKAVRHLYADDVAASMGLADDIRTVRAALSASGKVES